MTPDPTTTQGQDPARGVSQPGVSEAAQFYMSLRAEGPGGGAPPAAATPPAPADPNGQGAPPAGGTPPDAGGGFNWGNFPGVPEDQRALLEPHLKDIQGHVTRLEQSSAPYRELADAGLDANTVKGIMALNQAFDKDPTGTWVRMGREMQQNGSLPDTLDLDAVVTILEGKDVEEPAGGGGEGGEEEVPKWAQELKADAERRQQREDQETQTRAQQEQDQALNTAMEGMKSQLKEAGLSDDEIATINLTGPIIANQGDPDKATQEIINFWSAGRKSLTDNPTPGGNGEGPNMPNGAPQVDSGLKGTGRGSAFTEANKAAKQMLERRRATESGS